MTSKANRACRAATFPAGAFDGPAEDSALIPSWSGPKLGDLRPGGMEYLLSARRSVLTVACLSPLREPAFRRIFDEVQNAFEYLVTSGWVAHVDDRTAL